MVVVGSKHFFVFEFARLVTGEYVVPERWVKYKSEMCGEVFRVEFDDSGTASIDDSTTTRVKVTDFQDTFLDLSERDMVPQCDGAVFDSTREVTQADFILDVSTAKFVNTMPNPDRIIADGEPLYTSFIDYFGDDVSGNQSKSWNKHWNLYFQHRNLPRSMLQQEFHVHFLSTSPFASVSEQYSALKDQIEWVYPSETMGDAYKLLPFQLGQRTQSQFGSATPPLGRARKPVSTWMRIALTTQCRASRRAMSVQMETTAAVSVTTVALPPRRNRTRDITGSFLFVGFARQRDIC